MRSPALLFLAALAAPSLLLQPACGGDDDGGGSPDAMADPLCVEAEDHSDLAWIQDNVFSRSCANFNACHMGSALSAGGLNLEEGMAEAALVDVPSDVAAELGYEMDLVEPGDPEGSYLMHILGHYGDTVEENPRIDESVGFMPYNNERLCPEKVEAVARWIEGL